MLRDWEGEWAASRAAAEADVSVTVAAEPDPHGPCERCLDPESITTAGDHVANYAARLCSECGGLWLRTVLGDWDSSLAIFTGNASNEERQRHADLIAQREAAEAEKQERKSKRRAEAQARRVERKQQQNAVTTANVAAKVRDRSRTVAELVTARPRTVPEIAEALGVSYRTATRAIADAKAAGLVTTTTGSGAKVQRTQDSQVPLAGRSSRAHARCP